MSHLVNHGGGVEPWGKGTSQFLPIAVERIGTVLPSVHDVTRVKHGKELNTVQECIDSSKLVVSQVAIAVTDLSPLLGGEVKQIFEFDPVNLTQ